MRSRCGLRRGLLISAAASAAYFTWRRATTGHWTW